MVSWGQGDLGHESHEGWILPRCGGAGCLQYVLKDQLDVLMAPSKVGRGNWQPHIVLPGDSMDLSANEEYTQMATQPENMINNYMI